jgi:Na+/H+ antiporter NhaD/arsenite permease-like protein
MSRAATALAAFLVAMVAVAPEAALAAGESPYKIKGAELGILWVVPFVGILLSIALLPLFAPSFWHHHFGKVALGWAAAFVLPYLAATGFAATSYVVMHTLLFEYIPFIILLFALYTVAGGIFVKGNLHGTPALNTGILALGTALASFVGTTGASMILIRPIIRANDDRRHNVHVVVFFIFLVSNIGGSLTPLGDPPLFLGFLRGVDFFFTTKWMFAEMVFCAAILLAVFFVLDTYYYRKETAEGRRERDPTPDTRPGVVLHGQVNFLFLIAIILVLVASAAWKPGISFTIHYNTIELQFLIRDVLLIAIAFTSLALTPRFAREGNGFNWDPMMEVAKLFIGIFIAMTPVLAILNAGSQGIAAPLVALVSNPDGTPNNTMYFWLTGGLSSFLDNAPTYLVFFELAGAAAPQGQTTAQFLMTSLPLTLTAVSCGAVFMGANSYIGNAPNFMVKAIAENMGVKMPSFFGYCTWALIFLIPTFILLTFVFFQR